MTQPIVVSAVVLRDEQDRVLTVRKRGTSMYMLPGGKPELGESSTEAALREIAEEIGLSLDPARLVPVGEFLATAANEYGVTVRAMVFEYPSPIENPVAAAEIDDLRWMEVDAEPAPATSDVAPLLIDHVLRALECPRPRWVTVFAGSARGTDDAYADAAAALGELLAREGIGLVYGGGAVGLMGAVADAALAAGGQVVGVIPESLLAAEIAHPGLTRLEVVDGLHERKQRMAELGEAFVALPGGTGTLEELFEVWTWQQLGLHTKPVACLDVAEVWRPLFDLIDHLVEAGFVTAARGAGLLRAEQPEDLLALLRDWQPGEPKWSSPGQRAR